MAEAKKPRDVGASVRALDDPHRPTRDVDLLGYGDSAPEPMLATFREI